MDKEQDHHLSMVSIFVWTTRTSTKLLNGHYAPFEVITGLKPRPPLEAILSSSVSAEKITHEKYVAELIRYLKRVHQHADEQHALVRENAERAKLRELGAGTGFSVGGHCSVASAWAPGIPARLQRPNFDAYQVVAVHGDGVEAEAHTLYATCAEIWKTWALPSRLHIIDSRLWRCYLSRSLVLTNAPASQYAQLALSARSPSSTNSLMGRLPPAMLTTDRNDAMT